MSKSANWPLRITWIVVAILIAVAFAVALWNGLAYLGMTAIISLDYIAYPLSWMGVGPAFAWLIVGCFAGGVIGRAKALRSFGRNSEAKKLILLASVFSILFWTISMGATALVGKRAAAERVAREEDARRKAREAEEKARLDKAWSEGTLWQIASITNQTTRKIPFQVLNAKGTWDEYSVRPGATVTVWKKVRDLTIRVNSSYAPGSQEKHYTLASTPIIGREPNKADQARARANSFRANGNGLDVYQKDMLGQDKALIEDVVYVRIAPGEFNMGCSPGDNECGANEKPAHRVRITKAYEIGKYEVTQSQWQAVMGNNPSHLKDCPNCPVEQVSWNDIQDFMNKLNAKNDGFVYRLPTEAQWELAARAGTIGGYYGNLNSIAWYSDNSDRHTHPVGQKQANAFGVHDMSGNVWEWCQDWYGDYPKGDVTDPTGATSGLVRVLRGGGSGDAAVGLRSSFRASNAPSRRSDYVGFRVVRQQ